MSKACMQCKKKLKNCVKVCSFSPKIWQLFSFKNKKIVTDYYFSFFEVKILLNFTNKKTITGCKAQCLPPPSFTSQAIAIPPSHSLDVLHKIFQLIGYLGTIILRL